MGLPQNDFFILRQPPSRHNGIGAYVPNPLYFMAETFF